MIHSTLENDSSHSSMIYSSFVAFYNTLPEFDNVKFNWKLPAPGRYTVAKCYQHCMWSHESRNISCRAPWMVGLADPLPLCSNSTQLNRMQNPPSMPRGSVTCNGCPEACRHERYSAQVGAFGVFICGYYLRYSTILGIKAHLDCVWLDVSQGLYERSFYSG